MAAKKTLTFQVYKDKKLLKKAEFTEDSVTIGSGDQALFSMPGVGLAELHAVINVEEDGTVHLFDLGSDQGTKVNGETVSNTPLKLGNAITAGDVQILVTWKDAASARPAPAAFDDEEATKVMGSPPDSNATMSGMLDDDKTDPGAKKAAENKPATPAPAPKRTPAPAPLKAATPEPVAAASAAAAAHADHASEDEDDDHGPEEAPDDVIAMLIRGAQGDPAMKNKQKILEVNQIWGEALLDAKQYGRATTVTIGSSVHYPLRVMGIKLFAVPPPLNYVMPWIVFPPIGPLMGASKCESEWKNEFYAPPASLPGGADYKLIESKGGKYVVNTAPGWDGFVDVGETRYNSFEELAAAGKGTVTPNGGYEIPMSDETRVAVDIEGMVFFAQMVSPGRKAMANMTQGVDWIFAAIATLLMCAVMVFFVLVYLTPARSETSQADGLEDRYVELLMEKPEPEKKPGGNPDAGEGAKAKKEEGKVGKKDAQLEKAKGNKVEIKKQEMDRQIVDNAGIMGAMDDDALSQALGASGLSADIQGGIGGLIGAQGTQIGSGGLGARGSGIGGGGTAEGLGGLGTKGTGSGASGFGSGGGNFGQKGEGGIAGVGGDPIVIGALDRSLIDAVIKQHMNAIKYCYQRELTKNPALGGKIVIKFTIAKDGTTSSASTKSTTMSNQAVEQCIEGRFMRMQFPQPKGGGIVIVSYPFMFSPG